MKSGNTLRVARNSLLCFFMALVAGFLIACGDGGVATPRETPNAPARPAAPSASAQSDIEIEVTWSAVSDATSYKLYRSPSSGGSYTQVGGDIFALRYRDNRGLAPNTEYYYQLEACNSGGCSDRSPEVSATTRVSPPAPSVSAQSESEILVTWSAVSRATIYNLYRSPSSGGPYTQVGGDITALRYRDNRGLAPNTEYYYQLEACNSDGCSRRSPEVSATTRVSPPAPSVSAQSESEILVTWSAVSDATSYKLYWSPSSGGPYTQVGGDITALRYRDNRGLAPNTEYYYQLEACNSAGCSRRSPEVSVTTRVSPPAPSVFAQSESEILVTWSEAPGATTYNLYRSASKGGMYSLVAGDISALRYLDSGRYAGYYYQLEACNSGGCSRRSPEVSITQFFVYLSDAAAAEGVEYSGPTGKGLTGKGGVFLASEGVFEFSIGGITLGSVRLNSDWANNEVTPSDFMGVDDAQVITIARIMQSLDADGMLANGISISESARANTLDLFSAIATEERLADTQPSEPVTVKNYIGTSPLTISSRDVARNHLVATRQCLFSGGYVGSYRGVSSEDGQLDEGQVYYAVEPFANRAKRVEFSNVREMNDFALQSFQTSAVGVIGSVITLSLGNELFFVTPRLVTGIWQDMDNDGNVIDSGIHRLTLAAGNPGASRRIVGVETTDDTGETVAGLYVLDHFAKDNDGNGNFRGQYYDLETDGVSVLALSLTIVNGVSWPATVASNGMTTVTLTLSGMRGEDDASITVGIVRAMFDANAGENYGSFEGVGNELSGAWCDIGGSVGSTVSPTPLPRIPPAPSASAQSDIEIEVTWIAAPSATSYKLYRSPSSGGTYSLVDGDITALRYRDNRGLAPNTEYSYQLEACNSGGCSERSPEVSVTTQSLPDPPAQPPTPSASAQSESEILVTWIAVSGATTYKLYRSTSRSGGYAQIGGDISALRYPDSGRTPDTEYFYQLEACNRGGCSSSRSPEVSATTFPVAPAAPSASAQSESEILVTWSAVSGATSYNLYRSPSSSGTYSLVDGDISVLRYLDSGRSAGTEYFYQLEACNSAGCSSPSPEVSATTFPVAPAQPSASAQSDTEIEVTWSAVSGATSYKLYRSPSSGGTYTQIGGDISALRYLDTGRSASTEYFYQLEACNSAGCSATRSPAGSATTQATPVAPAQPSAPSASAQSDTEIEVTWNAVSGATSYKLYRSTSSGGTYTQVGGDISALRYLDTGRSASTEYFYQLEACNSAGCSATRSPAGSVTTQATPVAPAQPLAPSASAQNATEILVTWSAVSGATTYKLYRSTSRSGGYAQIGGDISALRYLDSGRTPDTEYFYQLEACNSAGCSATRSPIASATTPDDGQCRVGKVLAAGESCQDGSGTFMVDSTGRAVYGGFSAGGNTLSIGGVITAERRSSTTWEITSLG